MISEGRLRIVLNFKWKSNRILSGKLRERPEGANRRPDPEMMIRQRVIICNVFGILFHEATDRQFLRIPSPEGGGKPGNVQRRAEVMDL